MIELITTLALLWLAMAIVVFLHEVGHGGRHIKMHWGLFPSGASMQVPHGLWKFGGLAMNLFLAYIIFYFRPENALLQFIGLLSWTHFILYAILGSINKEIPRKKLIILNYKYPEKMRNFFKLHVFDDIPNELWWIFIPIGILVFWWMKDYYLVIATSIWQTILISLKVGI